MALRNTKQQVQILCICLKYLKTNAEMKTTVNPVRLKNNPIELDNATILSLYETIVKPSDKL